MAKNFTEPVARRFGVTPLHLLLIYKEVAGLELNPEAITAPLPPVSDLPKFPELK